MGPAHAHFRAALPDVVTLPQHFKNNGYFAQGIGKIFHNYNDTQDPDSWSVPHTFERISHFGDYALPKNRRGRPTVAERAAAEDEAYVDGQVASQAVDALRKIKGKPFFLAVGFLKPHSPYNAPERYWALYDDKEIPRPRFRLRPRGAPHFALYDYRELRGFGDVPGYGAIPDALARRMRQGYYAATSFVDAQIGKILDELKRLGLEENTHVVFWSDHGYHLGEHDHWTKVTAYELDARVPLIIAAADRRQAGRSTSALVELLDIYPTLCDLAGLRCPGGLEGESLEPLLRDPSARVKSAAFTQVLRPWPNRGTKEIMGYSVRTDRYRYVEWVRFEDGAVAGRELYDELTDADETENIAGLPEHAGRVNRMSELLRSGVNRRLAQAE